jgi:hypothetical protein
MEDEARHNRTAKQVADSLHRMMGRPFRIAREKFDADSVREVERLIRDVTNDRADDARKVKEPWRRW